MFVKHLLVATLAGRQFVLNSLNLVCEQLSLELENLTKLNFKEEPAVYMRWGWCCCRLEFRNCKTSAKDVKCTLYFSFSHLGGSSSGFKRLKHGGTSEELLALYLRTQHYVCEHINC